MKSYFQISNKIKILAIMPVFCLTLVGMMAISSCKKILDVSPEYIRTTSQVYASDASADSVLVGLYATLSNSLSYGSDIPLSIGLTADELVPNPNGFSTGYISMYNNELDPSNAQTNEFWGDSYNAVYVANSIIEGVAASQGMTAQKKKQCTGEAQFIRAFAYFYLVNFFGDVPLVTSTAYKTSSVLPRTASSLVYQQILKDLLSAESNLGDNYPTAGRVRANKWVVKAMLARVYLYLGDWADAAAKSGEVINHNTVYTLGAMAADPALMDIFHADSKEAIWQFWNNYGSALGGYTLGDYAYFLVSQQPPTGLISVFEAGDLRSINYVGYSTTLNAYYINKYKLDGTFTTNYQEYTMVFRLAEQYLIRAEARAQQGDIGGAQADINVIRGRAGLGNTKAADAPSLLSSIGQERRVELCFEWGDRWLNLKRLGQLDAVMKADKPTTWKATDALYPIPRIEIQNNSKLTQNPGYQ